MFQHLQLSHTQQPTLEGLYSSGPTIPSHVEQVTMYSLILVSSKRYGFTMKVFNVMHNIIVNVIYFKTLCKMYC